MTPSIGRSVHYRLSEDDVERITRARRVLSNAVTPDIRHGNAVRVGEVVSMTIVRVWPDGHGVNGQALLDGNDQLWVTSAREGTEPGTWSWPPRVEASSPPAAREGAGS
jgi:hypothetical protein